MNSTTTLQMIVDYVQAAGELQPVLPVAGFSVNTALTMATDVMNDMIAQRFNWKWNRMLIPPFYTISWQQDYAGMNSTYIAPIGWLENAYWVDINNTSLPKPLWRIEIARDIETTWVSGNPPVKIDWDYNKNLVYGVWPGAAKMYTQPLGALITPTNPPTGIRDANNNILVLTTYGTTGTAAPSLPANSAEGTTVTDGTVVWTVASPDSHGFRIKPLPPAQGVVYQINVIAQMKAPPPFTSMQQQINPVPDDYASWFREGFIVYCYRIAPNPNLRAQFPNMRSLWLQAMENAMRQSDREQTEAGFIPDKSAIAASGGWEIGPAWPFSGNYLMWPGR